MTYLKILLLDAPPVGGIFTGGNYLLKKLKRRSEAETRTKMLHFQYTFASSVLRLMTTPHCFQDHREKPAIAVLLDKIILSFFDRRIYFRNKYRAELI